MRDSLRFAPRCGMARCDNVQVGKQSDSGAALALRPQERVHLCKLPPENRTVTQAAIHEYLAQHNEKSKPFMCNPPVWAV